MGLDDVSRTYGRGDSQVQALRNASLTCRLGTWTAVTDPSGSGTSTLLHCAAGLERASSGHVRLAGRDIATSSLLRHTALGDGH